MAPPIRIAHVTPAFFSSRSVVGGGERYVYYLARALAAAGGLDPGFVQCIHACGGSNETFAHDGLPVRVMRVADPAQSGMDVTSDSLWRELGSADIVHVHQSLTRFGAFATMVARSLGKRIVLTDLGGGAEAVMLEGGGMRLADGVLSISAYARRLVESYFSGPHEVLIGPVDTGLFCPSPARPPRPPRPPRLPRRVVAIGRILPHKGFDRIIAALPSALSLTIVGRPYHEDYLRRLHALAAGKDVAFVHDADDDALLGLLRDADLFVQASTAIDCYGQVSSKPELMGLTTLEAMSVGVPVAVSHAGSLPELVTDPRFGRVFRNGEELAAIFESLLDGTWPAEGAAAFARAHVVREHGFAAIGGRLGAFYARIMGR